MSDPIATAIGVKLSSTVAGFAGGVVSLAFVQGLTRTQAVMAVLVGSLTAAYLTPAVVAKLAISAELQSGAAFVIGLCAMSIIPAIKKAIGANVDRYTQAPASPPKEPDA